MQRNEDGLCFSDFLQSAARGLLILHCLGKVSSTVLLYTVAHEMLRWKFSIKVQSSTLSSHEGKLGLQPQCGAHPSQTTSQQHNSDRTAQKYSRRTGFLQVLHKAQQPLGRLLSSQSCQQVSNQTNSFKSKKTNKGFPSRSLSKWAVVT